MSWSHPSVNIARKGGSDTLSAPARARVGPTGAQTLHCAVDSYYCKPNGQALPPPVDLDYWDRLRRRSHSPRAERIKVKPPSPPSTQSTQTKKKPPGDLAISP